MKEDYYTRVNRIIKAVIWKVNPTYRDDITSELIFHAVMKKEKFENQPDGFLFVAMRNKCVDMNRKEIKNKNLTVNIDSLNITVDHNLDLSQEALLLSKIAKIKDSFTNKEVRFLLTVIMCTVRGDKYPIVVARKIFHVRSSFSRNLFKKIREKVNELENQEDRSGQMPTVRTMEDLQEQLRTWTRR